MYIAKRARSDKEKFASPDSNLNEKSDRLANLFIEVQECRRCEQLEHACRVLSWANGLASAKVMFIGEAPGRLGADRTSIPFHGDKAGDNFEALLSASGILRSDVYVTNAALCNPIDEKGNNRPPSRKEIKNCTYNLKKQIDIIQPNVICTLGAVALRATDLIEDHGLTLSASVRTRVNWYGRTLIPLYHPGQRAMIHRSFSKQVSDYYFVSETINTKRRNPQLTGFVRDDVEQIIASYLENNKKLSLFAAHKLLYWAEYFARKGGETLGLNFIRQKDGPYCLELARKKFSASNMLIEYSGNKPYLVRQGGADLFSGLAREYSISEYALDAMKKIQGKTDYTIKREVYMSTPMRSILKDERNGHMRRNYFIFNANL